MIRHCAGYLEADPKGPDDEYVSVLPLPWIMEQIYVLGWGLMGRMKVNFVEEPETMMADFREIGPTFVLFAPRVWEAIAAEVRARVMDASPLKRRMFELGMKLGLAALDEGRALARRPTCCCSARCATGSGFTNLRSAATGGAALGPDTFRFFQAMGVPLRQLYGQTELLGAYTLHRARRGGFRHGRRRLRRRDRDAHRRRRTRTASARSSPAIPTCSPATSAMPDATADLRDGWLHTGDAGYFDKAGHLVVIDRIKDIATTSARRPLLARSTSRTS